MHGFLLSYPPDFVAFILRPNAALEYQTYIPILLQGGA